MIVLTTKQERTADKIALSVLEASEASSLSLPFLRQAIKDGRLSVVRPGNSRRVVILVDDFLKFLRGEKEDEK